jgi:hypothetical protein
MRVLRADGTCPRPDEHAPYLIAHDPDWQPTMLPVDAHGTMRPGFVCVHELENGQGACGGNVFTLDQAVGQHHCLVIPSRNEPVGGPVTQVAAS